MISSASDVASLATTPLTMTPPSNYNGSFTLHVTAIAADTATLTTGVATDTAATTHDFPVTIVAVDVEAPAAPPTLVSQTFLGGAGDQSATDVSYADGHLYLAYNFLPVRRRRRHFHHRQLYDRRRRPDAGFLGNLDDGVLQRVSSDGANIYAVGASHPGDRANA